MLLMRLTSAGRLDRSFGPSHLGYTTVAVGSIANAMAVERDGMILLGGSNANVPGRPMVVAAFTSRGLRDRRFGPSESERRWSSWDEAAVLIRHSRLGGGSGSRSLAAPRCRPWWRRGAGARGGPANNAPRATSGGLWFPPSAAGAADGPGDVRRGARYTPPVAPLLLLAGARPKAI
jgi:hypothetical protein